MARQYKFPILKYVLRGISKNDLNNIDDGSAAAAINIYECITLGQLAYPCKLSLLW